MIAFVSYPFYLLSFWYKDVVVGLFGFFAAFNMYVARLLSYPSLLKTFFKPLKNEYRDGLVLFSICFGVIIKSVLVAVNSLILLFMLLVEVLILLFLVVLPVVFLVLLLSPRVILR